MNRRAFTIIELLIVMSIIIILAGLVIATSGYVQEKSKRSRAEAEIAAMSAALESYKADNGIYPQGKSISAPPSGHPTYVVAATGTDDLDPKTDLTAESKRYQDASRYLYENLTGDNGLNFMADSSAKSYMTFKIGMLALIRDEEDTVVGLSHIRDPFGNSYGYSTSNRVDATKGYNPTFDLWSTAGDESGNQAKWIKNW